MHFEHLNLNSLLSKVEELRALAFNTDISVLWITVTKLDNTVSNEELKIDVFNLLRSDRNKNGGGVACYIKNNIAENIALDILLPKSKPITVGIIYRPTNHVDFINHFNNARGKLPMKFICLEILILICFLKAIMSCKNILKDLKEAQLKHRPLRLYVETFLTFGLNQLMKKPTNLRIKSTNEKTNKVDFAHCVSHWLYFK